MGGGGSGEPRQGRALSAPLLNLHDYEAQAADRLERAVAAVIKSGKDVTYDMKADRNDPTAVGTSQMADAIIRAMNQG